MQVSTPTTIREIRTETKTGEITINLNLTIHVEGNAVSVSAASQEQPKIAKPAIASSPDKVDFELPDISSVDMKDLLDFGKDDTSLYEKG